MSKNSLRRALFDLQLAKSSMGSTKLKLNYPIRFHEVSGFEERKNDIIYCRPLYPQNQNNLAIIFPGDVQDFTENMLAHRDNRNHKDWSLDNTAFRMQEKFPECHIMVVKPSRMDFKTFSCFKNFVESSDLGVPNHTSNYNALVHLDKLIKNLSDRLNNIDSDQLNTSLKMEKQAVTLIDNQSDINEEVLDDVLLFRKQNLSQCGFKIIGFSKGCVVLNQFVHEFHNGVSRQNQDILGIVPRITDMFWLDGGHSGGKNTWITDKNILNTFSTLDIGIHIHLSPYQMEDDRRPWIKKEEKHFSDILTKFGCKIDRQLHFQGIPPSIMLHFDIYKVFIKS